MYITFGERLTVLRKKVTPQEANSLTGLKCQTLPCVIMNQMRGILAPCSVSLCVYSVSIAVSRNKELGVKENRTD